MQGFNMAWAIVGYQQLPGNTRALLLLHSPALHGTEWRREMRPVSSITNTR